MSRYRFRSSWHLRAQHDDLFDVLADLGAYPRWWPQVRSVEQVDADSAWVVCRSVLPYDLRLHATRVREDRARGTLEVRLDGDLHGWSRWTVTPRDGGADLLYEQEVLARHRVLRLLGLVARPALRLNHAWMMRCGRHGLERRLSRTATDG